MDPKIVLLLYVVDLELLRKAQKVTPALEPWGRRK